jgi:hypothetical protein
MGIAPKVIEQTETHWYIFIPETMTGMKVSKLDIKEEPNASHINKKVCTNSFGLLLKLYELAKEFYDNSCIKFDTKNDWLEIILADKTTLIITPTGYVDVEINLTKEIKRDGIDYSISLSCDKLYQRMNVKKSLAIKAFESVFGNSYLTELP